MKNNIKPDASASELPDLGKDTATTTPRAVQRIALAMALLTSSISLGITVFAGLQRAASVEEKLWSVATSVVAGLCMHWLLMLCRFVSSGARIVLVNLWLLATFVVLRGQVDVLAFANVHAADKRAQTVAEVIVPSVSIVPPGGSLTAITRDIAKVSFDLAHVEARRCTGGCRVLSIRKAELSAELAALNAEAIEVKRRATEQDWFRDQASRAQALRESRRADPATSMVAQWLGTTEARLDLLLDFVCVIVLEGAACVAWYFAIPGPARRDRAAVVCDPDATALPQEAVAPNVGVIPAGRVELSATLIATAERDSLVNGSDGLSKMSEDDHLIEKIHEAVVAGNLRRDLASIRKFVRCGQPKAIRLNRMYIERFGNARGRTGMGVGSAS
ncbi:hypothetical protein [Paraburkholderia silvatlantica]|uniref:hypothetical protein n=1 Tax=Paraburkholderia silvatlantica TaxID=321895 RepID=UPI0037518286